MPIEGYFRGRGRRVLRDMERRYGDDRAKRVFFATANKRGEAPAARSDGSHARAIGKLVQGGDSPSDARSGNPGTRGVEGAKSYPSKAGYQVPSKDDDGLDPYRPRGGRDGGAKRSGWHDGVYYERGRPVKGVRGYTKGRRRPD